MLINNEYDKYDGTCCKITFSDRCELDAEPGNKENNYQYKCPEGYKYEWRGNQSNKRHQCCKI